MSYDLEYHRGLLADAKRTNAYRRAIHGAIKPGDTVVDLGSESGILSFFAAEAGASRIYAIDHSHMADVAELLANHLGLSDRVTVLHGPSSKAELPERADVLVTETMGPAGFDEGILSHVLDARRRLLKPDARIVPERLALFAAPVQLDAEYAKLVDWWTEPRYGFDLAPLRSFAANVMHLVFISGNTHLATGAPLIDVDLATFDSDLVRGGATFTARRASTVHGFAVWFEATLVDGVLLENRESRGSWSQGFLPLERPIPVKRGDRITLDIESDDGRAWTWRGKCRRHVFDHTSRLAMPPCGPLL